MITFLIYFKFFIEQNREEWQMCSFVLGIKVPCFTLFSRIDNKYYLICLTIDTITNLAITIYYYNRAHVANTEFTIETKLDELPLSKHFFNSVTWLLKSNRELNLYKETEKNEIFALIELVELKR
jgi:hypothetical protein